MASQHLARFNTPLKGSLHKSIDKICHTMYSMIIGIRWVSMLFPTKNPSMEIKPMKKALKVTVKSHAGSKPAFSSKCGSCSDK